MGLISSIYRRFFTKKPTKILMVGLCAAGKTTILYQLKHGKITSTTPTIGLNLETIMYKNISLTVWDMAGQSRLWRYYYFNTDAIIFVVDSSDRDYIEDAERELHNMLEEDELRNAVLLVFANKQDLRDAMSTAEIINELNLHTITNRKWHIQATSATQGFGLHEGLKFLSKELR